MRDHDVSAGMVQRQPAAELGRIDLHAATASPPDALQAAIDQSPRMVAQRRSLQATFGSAVPYPAKGSQTDASMETVAVPSNDTGIPEPLKSNIESMSGMDMSHVRVYYNSSRPAQLQAHAYAQGHEIYLAPGEEQYLPHEAWHLVQQAQGRVLPTRMLRGNTAINDDTALEREADAMGAAALQQGLRPPSPIPSPAEPRRSALSRRVGAAAVAQRHVLLGAMIKGQDNPAVVTPGDWANFNIDKVFDNKVHRGDLTDGAIGTTFNWDADTLAKSVKGIRNKSGFSDDDPNFKVVVNVNTYRTPGYEAIPASVDSGHVRAFGCGWRLHYNLNPFGETPNYSANYPQVLATWMQFPTNPLQHHTQPLGEARAAQVLRTLSKRYWQTHKNFVIPHRGLRNLVLEKINSTGLINAVSGEMELAGQVKDNFVSIIHLDDDLQTSDPNVVRDLMLAGEARCAEPVSKRNKSKTKAVAFSAPGYVYNMENNLLEYSASVLSHVAGRVVKRAYPSEPGLTVTYDRREETSVWKEFLLKQPWGEESADMSKLKSYGNKQQKARVESKEGRAFAEQYADYLRKRGVPGNALASNKVPLRGKGYVEVQMSAVAQKEIVGKGNPENVAALSESQVAEWINKYIDRNKYHPAGGTSADAKAFRFRVVPAVAPYIQGVLQSGKPPQEQQSIVRSYLEALPDHGYRQVMEDKGRDDPQAMDWDESIDMDASFEALEKWKNDIAENVTLKHISNANEMRYAANLLSQWIEYAARQAPELEGLMSDLVADTVAAYATLNRINPYIAEILDFLVAEKVYQEDYSDALRDMKEDERYRGYVEALER